VGTIVAFVLITLGVALTIICVDEVIVRRRNAKYWRCVEKQHKREGDK
jgi:hypothetical protein